MPYASNSELPKAVRDAYSGNCQSVFRHTWNSEYADHGDESRAFATAHAAAKRCRGGTKAMPLPLTTLKLFAPTLRASRDASTGKLYIEGVASSTIKDHHGDQLTLRALKKMESSSVGMTIFMNHEYRVPQDVFGTVESAKVLKSKDVDKAGQPIYDLRYRIGVAETNDAAVQTWKLINEDAVKLGLSIGAMVPDGGAAFDTTTKSYIVDDVDVVETSVIGIPANPRSFVDYIVKAFSGRYPEKLTDAKRLELAKEFGTEVELPDEPDLPEEEPDEPPAEPSTEEGDEKTGVEAKLGEIAYLTQGRELPPELLVEALTDDFDEAHFDTGGIETLVKESWSSAYKTALPDSAYACPGSRKYPHHSKSGAVDIGHLKAALSRVGDESNDQCGKAHLEAHARKLGIGDREKAFEEEDRLLIAAMDASFDLEKDGAGQHPHAHIHEHEHEHGYGNSKTVHNHEHAHLHSHEHDDDHEHASDQADWQHNHDHDGSYDEEHAHEGTEEESKEKDLEPDLTKATATVWTSDGDVIEVNTGRAKPKGDGQSAQTGSETAGATAKAKSIEEDDEPALIIASSALDGSSRMLKATYAQLEAARAENVRLVEERDAALGIAAKAVASTQALLTRVGDLPVGRKTQFVDVQKDFANLSGIYDAEVRQLMTKNVKR